ncbi:hypothetical protein [Baekduia sp. Peel2402]|uniref:hypothetical protein n=1 Tax=Baekduia sp. Peel2402 TaxID=3458296 RepID=UPI00403EE941
MSEHDIDDEPRAADDEEASPGRDRPDPRKRPPDPAGTQPKWDPDSLLPKETPRAAAGRLWATEAEGETATAAFSAVAEAPAPVDSPPAAATPSDDDDEPSYSRYSARFQFLLGALLAVGAAAIALLVAVVAGGQNDTKIIVKAGPAWSEWRPTATGGVDAAEQIAKHVGTQYKLPNGKQLVLVTGGALEVEQVPVTIAIQQPAARGGSVDLLDDGAGVMYRLNGIGTSDGHIPGKASQNRGLLVRREALELALYSFRYLGVSETVVLFPPTVAESKSAATGKLTQTKTAPTALLFRRDQADVQTALAHPLKSTLAKETPSVNGISRSADARTVSSITSDKLYTYKLQQANTDLRLFLVLNPIRLR